FQAEDGIRDFHVTGVQTCALPISDRVRRGDETVKIEPQTMRVLLLLARNAGAVVSQAEIERTVWADVVVTPSSVYQSIAQLRKRSEERRVGRECRTRGSREHCGTQ